MTFSIEFINNRSSPNSLDRPREYLEKLPDELFQLVIIELKNIRLDPFNIKKTLKLRGVWEGYRGWYPDFESKLKDYRIIYRVEEKIIIYRIGHHSLIYRK